GALVAGMDARIGDDHPLQDYEGHHHAAYELAGNWKVYVVNYLEGSHVPHVHPALNRMLDYRRYLTDLAACHTTQWTPLERVAGMYDNGDALYYWLWPNTMLNILPGRLQTNRVVPLGVDRCRVEFDSHYLPTAADGDRRAADIAFSDEVQQEDLGI